MILPGSKRLWKEILRYEVVDSSNESAGAGSPNTSTAQSASAPTSFGTIDITA